MNFGLSYAPATNYAKPLSNNMSVGSGLFSSFWAILLVILVVFTILVIYYKTIGYYLEIGWNKIYSMIMGRDRVDIEIGGDNGISAGLKPMDPPSSGMLPPGQRPIGMPGAGPSDSLSAALGSLTGPTKEVFNVSRNIYTYNDASAVCSALGAELASYEQLQSAYGKGADWCNYGWLKGQMAAYPTQQSTFDKLQKGAPEYRNACGRPGINGGYFDNPDLRFGVNCYGVRPSASSTSELLESQVALPPTTDEIEYEKKVQKFREQMSTMTILPFNRDHWSS